MANSESAFDKAFRDQVKHHGGHAAKNSTEMGAKGRPDASVKLPDWPHVEIEFKFWRSPGSKKEATELQRKWLLDYLSAGGLCGMVACVKHSPTLWSMLAKRRPDDEWVKVQDRKRGEPWNVGRAVVFLVTGDIVE